MNLPGIGAHIWKIKLVEQLWNESGRDSEVADRGKGTLCRWIVSVLDINVGII